MELATIMLQARASGPGLSIRFWFDGQQVGLIEPSLDFQAWQHQFSDQPGEHVLVIELLGKMPHHTVIDNDDKITQDLVAEISDFALDDIKLGHLFTECTQYHHDHNGTTDPVTQKFYGVMGCNGRVEMRFSTPIYLWLLENM